MLILEPYIIEHSYRPIKVEHISGNSMESTILDVCGRNLDNETYNNILSVISNYHPATAKDIIQEHLSLDVPVYLIREMLTHLIRYRTYAEPAVLTIEDNLDYGMQPIFTPEQIYLVNHVVRLSHDDKNSIEIVITIHQRRELQCTQ